MQMKAHQRSGFTLVELLVVVSIIALLISILLPSLRSARDQSKCVLCRNNLRSIWTGILMYSYEYNDRVPYTESVNMNGTEPDADPFDPQYPLSPGLVLDHYINRESWVCPAAVAGYPENANRGEWKMTYGLHDAATFRTVNNPYDKQPSAYTRTLSDPAMQNYIHFDGRPMRLIDGRRYVSAPEPHGNKNAKGYWRVRFPIISDVLGVTRDANGRPTGYVYPHRGSLDARVDMGNAREDYERDTGGLGKRPGYYELHADGDKTEIYLTRFWNASLGPS
ncbi:MAG: prepilin-type N-terminal cleavage/methylation domain-containing protein [Phycisphaerales bacterium]|nr:prepilin-type N-terminal cleavage/methylation domain-containing protein [Phycisphaerales bacterium]